MADDNRDWVLTKSLRELLPEHAVLVVAGNDWSAMIPYFAHKKALMIRNGLEYDRSYLAQAFHDLQGEDVCAFVALGSLRENQQLLGFAQRSFRLDRKPTFQAEGVDVYVARRYREAFVRSMEEDAERYPGATVSALSADGEDSGDEDGRLERTDFALGEAERRFPLFEGRFLGALSPFPLVDAQVADGPAVVVHPPLQMWFNPDLRAGTAHWSVRIYPAAYENREPWDRTDGVLFSIWVENSRGERKQLFRRFLDPANRTEDRGWQEFRVPYALNPEDGLVFVTDPGVSDSFDWAQCRRIGFEAL